MTDDTTATTTAAPIGPVASAGTLLRSTLIAAVAAAVLLVTVVLPAEYGVDPTGIGRAIGLTKMGEIKMSLAREAAEAERIEAAALANAGATAPPVPATPAPAAPAAPAAASPVPANPATPALRADTTVVTLQPNQAREFKLAMRDGARVTYAWSTDGGRVNFDVHGDRSAAPAISYHGYTKGTGVASDAGELVAAFDGMHGWFWRNRTANVVTVTLRTAGDYQGIREIE